MDWMRILGKRFLQNFRIKVNLESKALVFLARGVWGRGGRLLYSAFKPGNTEGPAHEPPHPPPPPASVSGVCGPCSPPALSASRSVCTRPLGQPQGQRSCFSELRASAWPCRVRQVWALLLSVLLRSFWLPIGTPPPSRQTGAFPGQLQERHQGSHLRPLELRVQ